MPCKNCGLKGHNRRTCLQHINKLDDITIDSKKVKTPHTSDVPDCVICFNKIKYQLETPCQHLFCSKCIFTNITHGNFNCPLCRTPLVRPKMAMLKKYRRRIRKLKLENQQLHYKLYVNQSTINIDTTDDTTGDTTENIIDLTNMNNAIVVV